MSWLKINLQFLLNEVIVTDLRPKKFSKKTLQVQVLNDSVKRRTKNAQRHRQLSSRY
jgi:hypothetical protein